MTSLALLLACCLNVPPTAPAEMPLDPDVVREAVMQAFLGAFPGAKVELTSVEVPDLQMAAETVLVEGALPQRIDPRRPIPVRLDIRSKNESRIVYVQALARIEVAQPVLRVSVPANSPIRPEQVEWKLAPLEDDAETPLSFSVFQGMLTKRELQPGQILRRDLLYAPRSRAIVKIWREPDLSAGGEMEAAL